MIKNRQHDIKTKTGTTTNNVARIREGLRHKNTSQQQPLQRTKQNEIRRVILKMFEIEMKENT